MSTYPTLGQSKDSTETRISGITIDRATNGLTRGRSFFTSDKKTFTVVHSTITTAQKTTLEAFYNTNKNNSFIFLWVADGFTYTCIFAEDAIQFSIITKGYWDATVSLAQV